MRPIIVDRRRERESPRIERARVFIRDRDGKIQIRVKFGNGSIKVPATEA